MSDVKNVVPKMPVTENANIHFIGATHPLKTSITEFYVSYGGTVAEILRQAQPDSVLLQDAKVFINSVEIDCEYWETTYPAENSVITARIVPYLRGSDQGQSKNPLRTILSVVVMAAAYVYGGPLGASLGFSSASIAGGAASFASIAGGALISTAGILLVNAIAPITIPALQDRSSGSGAKASPALFIEGGRNRAHPFAPIPSVLGFYRYHPPLGATTYTEALGDTNRFRMLLLVGLGPLELSDWRIGDTPIEEFQDYALDVRNGLGTDTPLENFPSQVEQIGLSIKLTVSSGYHVRNSALDADELSVDIGFPGGLIKFNNIGKAVEHTIEIELSYRKVGTTPWFPVPNPTTTFDDSQIIGTTITLTSKRTGGIQHGIRWSTPERTNYEIRLRRIAPPDTEGEQSAAPGGHTEIDKVFWIALRTFTNDDPIKSPIPLAKASLVIRATDQLSGVLDELNVMIRSIVLDWNSGTSTWSPAPSNNPASLFRHVLQGPGKAIPVLDSEIDLEKLQEWHEFCEGKGFTFNMVRDFSSSVFDTLADIASSGRAGLDVVDGKWSVVIDKPVSITSTYINPRNSTNFDYERLFEEVPHAWRIRFPNEGTEFKQDERTVYRDGYTELNATLYAQMEFPGVTNSDQIWKLGRYYAAVAVQRPERWTVTQDFESLIVRRGMRVKIAHDVMLVGLAYGRIADLTIVATQITAITVDEDLTMESGKNYGLSVRRDVGGDVSQSISISTSPGTFKTVTPVSPVLNEGDIEIGDLFNFGEFGQEEEDALVLSVIPQSDFAAKITLIPYRGDEIYDADSGVIPPYVPTISVDLFLPLVIVEHVVSDGTIFQIGVGGANIVQLLVQVKKISFESAYLEVQQRTSGIVETFYPSDITQLKQTDVRVGGLAIGETWDLRLRWNHESYLPGPWVIVPDIFVAKTLGPVDILQYAELSVLESGPVEPVRAFANMWWYNTTNDVMNQRSNNNVDWAAFWDRTDDSWRLLLNKGADIPSAAILVLGKDGNYFDVTGTNPISGIEAVGVGTHIKLHFNEVLTLTHNPPDLVLPGGLSILTQVGDEAELIEYEPGRWRVVSYTRADGTALVIKHGVGDPIPSTMNMIIDEYKDYFEVSGTTDISSFTVRKGRRFVLYFLSELDIISGPNLVTKDNEDINVQVGDVVEFYSIDDNVVHVINHHGAIVGGVGIVVARCQVSSCTTIFNFGFSSISCILGDPDLGTETTGIFVFEISQPNTNYNVLANGNVSVKTTTGFTITQNFNDVVVIA